MATLSKYGNSSTTLAQEDDHNTKTVYGMIYHTATVHGDGKNLTLTH